MSSLLKDGVVASLAAAGVAATAALGACVGASGVDTAATTPVSVRVLVKLARPADDTASIGAEAARRAGVPVTYAAAVSPVWHALALHCVSEAQCASAVARLRDLTTIYEAVEIDSRKARS